MDQQQEQRAGRRFTAEELERAAKEYSKSLKDGTAPLDTDPFSGDLKPLPNRFKKHSSPLE